MDPTKITSPQDSLKSIHLTDAFAYLLNNNNNNNNNNNTKLRNQHVYIDDEMDITIGDLHLTGKELGIYLKVLRNIAINKYPEQFI